MPHPIKPLSEQAVVITGASSGIGLATARRAASAGARVLLVARNADALRHAAETIRADGGTADWLAIDLTEPDAPARIAAAAERAFGGFDAWVNNASASLYARLRDTTDEEHRRVFDVGYFALVAASLHAADLLAARGGGAIVNVASTLADRSVPMQGAYSAMKHAVAGFTEALRTELAMDGAPVRVTLIKPHGIDTPFPEHARNRMGQHARIPPIAYDPELVAEAICFALSHSRRTLTVGGQGVVLTRAAALMPRLADRIIAGVALPAQTTDVPPEPSAHDNLFAARSDGRMHSNQRMYVRRRSLALMAQMHPWRAAAMVAGVAVLLTLGGSRRRPAVPDVSTSACE